jgi:hypothetical protein
MAFLFPEIDLENDLCKCIIEEITSSRQLFNTKIQIQRPFSDAEESSEEFCGNVVTSIIDKIFTVSFIANMSQDFQESINSATLNTFHRFPTFGFDTRAVVLSCPVVSQLTSMPRLVLTTSYSFRI